MLSARNYSHSTRKMIWYLLTPIGLVMGVVLLCMVWYKCFAKIAERRAKKKEGEYQDKAAAEEPTDTAVSWVYSQLH